MTLHLKQTIYKLCCMIIKQNHSFITWLCIYQCDSVVKNLSATGGDVGSIPGWGRSPEGENLPEKSYGERSLVGNSP